MDHKLIIKITLPPDEILAVKLHVCHVIGCEEQFANSSHLQMHLTRRHKLAPPANTSASASANNDDQVVKHYHCPQESCIYHLRASGVKFFSSFRSLKQHYLKLHSERNFVCFHCYGQKSFATESLLRAHQTNCGQAFICKVCSFSYGSREALLTHTKRKNHGYEELLAEKGSKRKAEKYKQQESIKVFKNTAQSTVQVQTEVLQAIVELSKKTQITQTDENQQQALAMKSECSTQTVILEPGSPHPHNTSTMDNFCQTNLEQFNYFEDTNLANFENVSAPGSQQCHTPTSPESVICVCTETQTDLIYDTMFPNEDRTDPMLYSHMYTQTCDDIFSELGLSTIETQTNWDGLGEFLVSAETQTNVNRCGSGVDSEQSKGSISSSQTQTSASMEFLNAISSESSSIHTQTS